MDSLHTIRITQQQTFSEIFRILDGMDAKIDRALGLTVAPSLPSFCAVNPHLVIPAPTATNDTDAPCGSSIPVSSRTSMHFGDLCSSSADASSFCVENDVGVIPSTSTIVSAIAASGSSFVSVPRIANNAVSLPQEQLKPISKFPSSLLDFSPNPTINQPQLLVPSIQPQTQLQSLFQPQSLPDSLSQRQPYDNQHLAQADLAENLFKNRSAAAYESKMMKSLRANEYCSSDDHDSHASIDDFEFRLEDPMMMPQTDELFFEEKLVSLQFPRVCISVASKTTMTLRSNEILSPERAKSHWKQSISVIAMTLNLTYLITSVHISVQKAEISALVRLHGRPPPVMTRHHRSSWFHLMPAWPPPDIVMQQRLAPSRLLDMIPPWPPPESSPIKAFEQGLKKRKQSLGRKKKKKKKERKQNEMEKMEDQKNQWKIKKMAVLQLIQIRIPFNINVTFQNQEWEEEERKKGKISTSRVEDLLRRKTQKISLLFISYQYICWSYLYYLYLSHILL
ncbi:hypothetical protein NE237_003475 [Protea cynaroides]|uniref:Uncharacterized protein n=1 Tax=Protea cynaroides TaxID=273540 RepID=A0A9Q0KH55_9MAGN|nr:hypothetical protein NE237_003475 [Protea cynaroides]